MTYGDEIRAIAMDLKTLATPAQTSLDASLVKISQELYELADGTEIDCDICGDYHEVGSVPYGCKTGDGH